MPPNWVGCCAAAVRSRLVAGLVAASAAIPACATTTPTALTPEGARVHVADANADANRLSACECVGDFSGSYSSRGHAALYQTDQVRNAAAKYGATDVVFDWKAQGVGVGRGYRCP